MNFLVGHQLEKSLKQLRDGNSEALADIYTLIGRQMFALSLSIINDYQLAEDCIQESLIKILNGAKNLNKDEKALSWIMTIVRNTSLDLIRKNTKEQASEDIVTILDQTCSVSFSEDSIAVKEALNRLSDEERQVVLLKSSIGLKYSEIGKMIGKTDEATKKLYQRALEKMKTYLS